MNLSDCSVAVIGANGMLAADVLPLLQQKGARLALFDRFASERAGTPVLPCDVTQAHQVAAALSSCQAKLIFNLSAYTAVDLAEKEYSSAFAVNGMGPGHLARWAKANAAHLVHISTDYVFGGDKELAIARTPISETRPTTPCGVYGESKRMGEELVLAHAPEYSLIVRTSWLHGTAGPNFVDTIRRVLHEKIGKGDHSPLKVVNDQFGSPTWCGWLAETLVALVEKDARGIYHASSRGNISWQEFAQAIAEIERIDIPVLPQSSAELNRPAPRPPYSTLDVSKLERFLDISCPSWKVGLEAHLRKRREETNA